MKVRRQKVYDAIDSEREYQEQKWKNLNKIVNNPSWIILWMLHFLENAKRLASTSDELKNSDIMAEIRKVTALGVAAMEYNGAPFRDEAPKEDIYRCHWHMLWEQLQHIPNWEDEVYMSSVHHIISQIPIEKLKTLFKEEIRKDLGGMHSIVTIKI